jgi:hypothetical protein
VLLCLFASWGILGWLENEEGFGMCGDRKTIGIVHLQTSLSRCLTITVSHRILITSKVDFNCRILLKVFLVMENRGILEEAVKFCGPMK